MSDWLGLLFLVLLAVGALVGLKLLSKPQTRTEEEFERNAAENTTMLGAGMSALQGFLDPQEGRAKEVRQQMKEGRYMKKKREGKAGGDEEAGDAETGETNESETRP